MCNQLNYLSPVSHFLWWNQPKLCCALGSLMVRFQASFVQSLILHVFFKILIPYTIRLNPERNTSFPSLSLLSTARFAPAASVLRNSKGRCDKLPPLIILMCWLFPISLFCFQTVHLICLYFYISSLHGSSVLPLVLISSQNRKI